MPKKTAPSKVAAFQQLLAGGATIAAAAKATDIGLSTAYNLPREAKSVAAKRESRTRLSKQEIATARSMFENGAKQIDVATALGRSASTISTLRSKMRINSGRKANPTVEAAQEALTTTNNGSYVIAVSNGAGETRLAAVSASEVGELIATYSMGGGVVRLFKQVDFKLTAEVLS